MDEATRRIHRLLSDGKLSGPEAEEIIESVLAASGHGKKATVRALRVPYWAGSAIAAAAAIMLVVNLRHDPGGDVMTPESGDVSTSGRDIRVFGVRQPFGQTDLADLTADERAYLDRLEHGDHIQVTVVVTGYLPASESSGEPTRWYDVTLLRVTAPREHLGASVSLHYEGTLPESSPWRNERATYQISIPRAVLERHGWGRFGPGVIKKVELLEGPRPPRTCDAAPPPGTRKPESQESLVRELAGLLKWLSSLRKTERLIRIGSWCEWQDEVDLGVRSAMPSDGPPPVDDLPDVDALVGLSRARILTDLGEPVWGCHEVRAGDRTKTTCAEAKHIEYPFYHLEGGPGGGPDVWLDFDDAGTCTRARWVHTQ